MDNSQTHKEGVSYTYKGYNGYAPITGQLHLSRMSASKAGSRAYRPDVASEQ